MIGKKVNPKRSEMKSSKKSNDERRSCKPEISKSIGEQFSAVEISDESILNSSQVVQSSTDSNKEMEPCCIIRDPADVTGVKYSSRLERYDRETYLDMLLINTDDDSDDDSDDDCSYSDDSVDYPDADNLSDYDDSNIVVPDGIDPELFKRRRRYVAAADRYIKIGDRKYEEFLDAQREKGSITL